MHIHHGNFAPILLHVSAGQIFSRSGYQRIIDVWNRLFLGFWIRGLSLSGANRKLDALKGMHHVVDRGS